MSKIEIGKRYFLFSIGLLINAFGVSFITKANLGTSPISSIPYTLSLGFKPTLGMFTLYMSLILVILQIILLRKNFQKESLLQIPVSFIFSWCIDLSMHYLSFMKPTMYGVRLISLCLGCLILGVGVYLEMAADVVMLPGEAFVRAISVTFQTDFGKTKIAFDSSMTLLAGVIGFVFLHKLAGIREGTVIAAIMVGMVARFLKENVLCIGRFLVYNRTNVKISE